MRTARTVLLVTLLFMTGAATALGNKNGQTNEDAVATADTRIVATAQIGYIDKEGSFVEIDKDQLEHFFRKVDFIGDKAKLDGYHVRGDGGTSERFVVVASATEGSLVTTMRFGLANIGQNRYALSDGGCACTSTNDEAGRYEVSEFGPCSCSAGGDGAGSCTKTSSRHTPSAIAAFFL